MTQIQRDQIRNLISQLGRQDLAWLVLLIADRLKQQ